MIAWNLGGVRFPRFDIQRIALQDHVAWLLDHWTDPGRGRVGPGDPAIGRVFERMCNKALAGKKGILEVMGADPRRAAMTDTGWSELQMSLRTSRVRPLVREFLLQWCRETLQRQGSFAAVVGAMDALVGRLDQEVESSWGAADLEALRKGLRLLGASELPVALTLGDSRYRNEQRLMAGRLLLFLFRKDIRDVMVEVRERCVRLRDRLRDELAWRRAEGARIRIEAQDPFETLVLQGPSVDEDVAELLHGVRVELSPLKYQDEQHQWFDPLGGNDGADAASEEVATGHLAALMLRVERAAWASLEVDGRASLVPAWGQVDSTSIDVERIEAGTVAVQYHLTAATDPFARPPALRLMLAGPGRDSARLPQPVRLYQGLEEPMQAAVRHLMADGVELLVFRTGFVPGVLALRSDPGVLRVRQRRTETQVLRSPYDGKAVDLAGLAMRVGHLVFAGIRWKSEGVRIVPVEAEPGWEDVVSVVGDGIHFQGLAIRAAGEGFEGFPDLVTTIERLLAGLAIGAVVDLRRGLVAITQRMKSGEKDALVRVLVRAFGTPGAGTLNDLGRSYVAFMGMDPPADKAEEAAVRFADFVGV
jgi:hypothetical protein